MPFPNQMRRLIGLAFLVIGFICYLIFRDDSFLSQNLPIYILFNIWLPLTIIVKVLMVIGYKNNFLNLSAMFVFIIMIFLALIISALRPTELTALEISATEITVCALFIPGGFLCDFFDFILETPKKIRLNST